MKNKTKLEVAGAIFLALCANISSWAVDFPSASGDISSATDWGGTLPSTTTPVRFNTNNGVYTAANDVQFGAMTVTAANVTFNMGVGEGEDPRSIKINRLEAFKKNQVLTLNGGLWDVQNGFFITAAKDKSKNGGNQLLAVTGGAVVTNVGTFRIAYKDSGNTVQLTDGSKMYVANGYWDYGRGVSNALEVLSGSEIVFSGYLRDSSFDSSTPTVPTYSWPRITVSGAGSKLRITSTAAAGATAGFTLGYNYGGGVFTVSDGAEASTVGGVGMGFSAYAPESSAVIRSGGSFQIAKNLVIGAASSTFGHVLAVSNATSAATISGELHLGSKASTHSNAIVIDDGGRVSVSGNVFVSSGEDSCSNRVVIAGGGELALSSEWKISNGARSHDNVVVVTGGGKITGNKAMRIADSTTARGNRVEITDGGELHASTIYLGGYSGAGTTGGGCTSLLVSNATVKCTRVVFGQSPTCVSNRLTVTGRNTDFSMSYDSQCYLFGVGSHHELELSDGASWSHDVTINLDSNACSNRLTITRGAKLSITGSSDFISGIGASSGANRVEVLDGASLEVGGSINVTHRENVLVVSNATVSAGVRLYVGNAVNSSVVDSICGNRFEIYGTNSVVSTDGAFNIYRDSTLLVSLPEEGYVGNAAPVRANSASIAASATLAIEGIAEMRRCTKRTSSRIALIHTATGVTVPSDTIDAVNASFVAAGAPDCRLYVSADGKDLMLKVPLCKGFNFTIR